MNIIICRIELSFCVKESCSLSLWFLIIRELVLLVVFYIGYVYFVNDFINVFCLLKEINKWVNELKMLLIEINKLNLCLKYVFECGKLGVSFCFWFMIV